MNSYTDEMRYWRNLAMQRGHQRLDSNYINNAIRDIYENNTLRNDRDDLQTRRSRTPHPHRAFTPHIPRAHTSHGPRGNQSHPHALTPNFSRPVVPPEESTSHSLSGIQFHPLLQPPHHRPLPPYQQQPHSSHTPAYSRPTELDPIHPSRSPYLPSHPLVNEGVRINSEPMLPNYHSQWRSPFARDTLETWRTPHPSSGPIPALYAFRFPTRPLIWTPDSYPHPYVPAAAGWTGNAEFGQELGSGQQRPAPPPASAPVQQPPAPPPASALGHPQLDPYTAAHLLGRWPFSGISPWWPPLPLGTIPGADTVPQWSPGTWPPMPWPTDVPVRLAPWLIPNPVNPGVPQLDWDVSLHPTTARRVTGAHVTLPLDSAGGGSTGIRIDNEPATSPASDRIVVLCDVGLVNQLWGPIVIERPGRRVTVRDLLEGIYAFFQTHLTHAEVERISSLGEDNYRLLVDAYRKRTTQRQLGVLRDWEWREGMRRVDCLGDGRWWWGVWVTYNSNETWQLNLGLVNPAHRNT
ncbi:hypothetical protein EDD17DRAFT_1012609 [Pisolithus thermaeus]|nr:hypothetical protein EV401DRAFT_1454406 [Pisolithus croceorrhizus]KAI6158322.1 hypothetical protein EDD17DRAFT_1012609 [Pisolithus thermaeus]